jgi:O-antigen/teichoic acid export membrane protein
VAGCKDTIRGLERTDIPAFVHVVQGILNAALVVAVFLAGGKLRAFLLAQGLACAIMLVVIWRTLRPVGVTALQVRWEAIKSLFKGGTPFVATNLAMALGPLIDSIYLEKYAPSEVLGWYAVSGRLVGALIVPANALMAALYPTLCRLHGTDMDSFKRTTSGSLRSVSLLMVPMALACALYPEIGVSLFSRKSFGPAEDNLGVLAIWMALVYFTMPLGTSVIAAGKSRAWSIVQAVCVPTALLLDWKLVPYFQENSGNGGLGVCWARAVSEAVIVASGVVLAPRGIFDRRLVRAILSALLSGAAMVLVWWVARPLGPWVSAPLALIAYAVALRLTGGIESSEVAAIRGLVERKLLRRRGR